MNRLVIFLLTFFALFGQTYCTAGSPALSYFMHCQGKSFISEYLNQDEGKSPLQLKFKLQPLSIIHITHDIDVVNEDDNLLFIAYFENIYSITCIEGSLYGKQVFFDDKGEILGFSSDFTIETIGDEEMMVHVYENAKFMTGDNVQIIHVEDE